jgi:hypothetical protein
MSNPLPSPRLMPRACDAMSQDVFAVGRNMA